MARRERSRCLETGESRAGRIKFAASSGATGVVSKLDVLDVLRIRSEGFDNVWHAWKQAPPRGQATAGASLIGAVGQGAGGPSAWLLRRAAPDMCRHGA